jgi:hypothetical protein
VTTATAAPAYATLDDVLKFFQTPPKTERQERLQDLLASAADELNDELKRDFFRHPTTGEHTWTVDGRGWCPMGAGAEILCLHRGVVSLSLVEISYDYGVTFTELAATDWALQWGAFDSEAPPEGEPYFHLALLVSGAYRTFPRGRGTVRLTGAEGFDTPPRALVEGNAERARQLAAADPLYAGTVSSPPDEGGLPSVSTRWPDLTYRFIERWRRRFYACEL